MPGDGVDGGQAQGAIRFVGAGAVARQFDRMPADEFIRPIAAAHAFLGITQPGVVKPGGAVPQRHDAELGMATRAGIGLGDIYPVNRRQVNPLRYGFHQAQQLVSDVHEM